MSKHSIIVEDKKLGKFAWQMPDDLQRMIQNIERNGAKQGKDVNAHVDKFLDTLKESITLHLSVLTAGLTLSSGQKDEKSATKASAKITGLIKMMNDLNRLHLRQIVEDAMKRGKQ